MPMRETPMLVRALIAAGLALLGLASPTAQAQVADTRLTEDQGNVRAARTYHVLFKKQDEAAQALAGLLGQPEAARFEAFKNLARTRSIDGGSARSGGDLGKVYPGEMVRTFEQAVFASKVREVTGPVRTDFGWHLVYVESFSEESVAQLCQRGAELSHAKATGIDQLGLKAALERPSRAELDKVVVPLLGPSWLGPLQDGDRNMLFLQAAAPMMGSEFKLVSRHIEFTHAKLATSNAQPHCVRSKRDGWAIDCKNKLIGFAYIVEYEGRAGTGPKVMEHRLPLRQIQMRPVNPGNSEIQLHDFACRPRPGKAMS